MHRSGAVRLGSPSRGEAVINVQLYAFLRRQLHAQLSSQPDVNQLQRNEGRTKPWYLRQHATRPSDRYCAHAVQGTTAAQATECILKQTRLRSLCFILRHNHLLSAKPLHKNRIRFCSAPRRRRDAPHAQVRCDGFAVETRVPPLKLHAALGLMRSAVIGLNPNLLLNSADAMLCASSVSFERRLL